jgi:hypothetical protein
LHSRRSRLIERASAAPPDAASPIGARATDSRSADLNPRNLWMIVVTMRALTHLCGLCELRGFFFFVRLPDAANLISSAQASVVRGGYAGRMRRSTAAASRSTSARSL